MQMVTMVAWPGWAVSVGVLPLMHPSLRCRILPACTFTFLICLRTFSYNSVIPSS